MKITEIKKKLALKKSNGAIFMSSLTTWELIYFKYNIIL